MFNGLASGGINVDKCMHIYIFIYTYIYIHILCICIYVCATTL